jgi:hypothetical protein
VSNTAAIPRIAIATLRPLGIVRRRASYHAPVADSPEKTIAGNPVAKFTR